MDREKLKQSLLEAGCCDDISRCIVERFESGNTDEAIRLMKKERCRAMDEYHESGKKVDCMDFLLRNLKKEMNNN
ncbi:MAG: hypothetical protein IKN54_08805 [Lachnospiraceae bacterium]|nr:hypothetical protein [Lachnospiraceae bacterium]